MVVKGDAKYFKWYNAEWIPLICKGTMFGLCLRKQITISLHFLTFKHMSFCSAHCCISSRSDCIVNWSHIDRDSERVRSSTYFQWLLCADFSTGSLIITRNKIGPSLVPCGTPPLTLPYADWNPPILTSWRQLERKSQIHGIIHLLTPSNISFPIRMLWFIRWNALLKSKKHTLR